MKRVRAPTQKATPTQKAALRVVRRALVAWVVLTAVPVLLLRWVDPPTSAFMLQRRWQASGTNKPFTLKYLFVPRARISDQLVRALVAAEDGRFLEHHGFDFEAMRDALDDRLTGARVRGASTLSQQVAKNLFLWPARSPFRKALEAYFTVLIELLWSKERILEVHLNIAEYGDGVYGVEMASRTFFKVPASTVSAEQAARLVAVLPAPKRRSVTSPTPMLERRVQRIRLEMNRLPPHAIEGL